MVCPEPVKVVLSCDRMTAGVQITSGALSAAEMVTGEYLEVCARSAGVEITAAAADRLREAARAFASAPAAMQVEIARGQAAVDGADGYVTWEAGFDPAGNAAELRADGEAMRIDMYGARHEHQANAGQVIGRLHAPTPGEDGRDVCGRVIAAKPGRVCRWAAGANVLVDAEGRMIAEMSGEVVVSRNRVSVTSVKRISGSVDFSTGSIQFDGSVQVSGGVQSRFYIEASGNVEVAGLVESARIDCGGDLTCAHGMAAQGRGEIHVGGSLTAGYLDAVMGEVGEHLRISREIIGSEVEVRGDLVGEGASIIGGATRVKGSIVIGTLGSEAYTVTDIWLSGLAEQMKRQKELEDHLQMVRGHLSKRKAELEMIAGAGARATREQREAMTELCCDAAALEQEVRDAEAEQKRLASQSAELQRSTLRVQGVIYPNVRLHVGERVYEWQRMQKGPLVIGIDEANHAELRSGSQGSLRAFVNVSGMQERRGRRAG